MNKEAVESFLVLQGVTNINLETFDEDSFLAHYGVKGMRWGVRRSRPEGVSARTNREAKKDATEFAKAKMFYGEGAGTRRKLIRATVEAKATRDPAYKKAFDAHISNQDMSKRASQARAERRRKDTSQSARKTARGIGHILRGNSQYASLAAFAIAGIAGVAYKNGGDRILREYGGRAVSAVTNEVKMQRTRRMMREAGF